MSRHMLAVAIATLTALSASACGNDGLSRDEANQFRSELGVAEFTEARPWCRGFVAATPDGRLAIFVYVDQLPPPIGLEVPAVGPVTGEPWTANVEWGERLLNNFGSDVDHEPLAEWVHTAKILDGEIEITDSSDGPTTATLRGLVVDTPGGPTSVPDAVIVNHLWRKPGEECWSEDW